MNPKITLTRLNGFGRGKKETFDGDAVGIGTDRGCELRLDATWDKGVSAKHLHLEWQGSELWVVDASKAGTFVRGQKVARAKIEPGTEIELGQGGPRIKVDYTPAPVLVPVVSYPAEPAWSSPPPLLAPAPQTRPVTAEKRTTAPKPQEESKRLFPVWAWGVLAAVMIALVAGGLWWKREETPERALAAVVKEYSDAVALVVLVHPMIDEGKPQPIATAWAVGPRVFATNAHVSLPVKQTLEKGGTAYLVINRKPDLKLKVVRAVVHPKYDQDELNFEGKTAAVPAYDVGLLYTDEAAPKVFKPAARLELERLDSGYRIGFLGFPMEGISGGGVDMRSPVATMQSGIVTSVTDFWLAQARFEKRLLVQHNMGSAGGASGSPIFNSRGEVVAILNAGNIIGQVSFDSGKVIRAPSAAMVNYAQRIDLLADIWPEWPR